jgi:ABC-type multidrug transport system fused ATPase/permease subunit
VLTIAHRLGTVLDSDKVLVLDDGKVAEFDAPGELMKKKGGAFRGLVEASEKSENS